VDLHLKGLTKKTARFNVVRSGKSLRGDGYRCYSIV
jgi:hypothetical protein